MAVVDRAAETIVCHCLEVTEQQIRVLVDTAELQTVEEVSLHTGAGTGCTACHCRIRQMLAGLPPSCGLADSCSQCGFHGAQCACRSN